jgi:hypothetical protein
MANFEINTGGDRPLYSDPTLAAIDEVLITLGAEPSARPAQPTPITVPRRASDIRAELTPDPPSAADITWVKTLMRDEPIVAMTTTGSRATIPMYSTFTDRPDGKLKFLFRSFESTEHASVIDENAAAGIGRTAIQLLLYRSGALNIGVELFGYARRVPEDQLEEYEEIYQSVRDRRGHNPGELWGRLDYPMYVIEDWEDVQMQTRLRNRDGEHVSNGKVGLPVEELLGFETPPDEPTDSDQSWR